MAPDASKPLASLESKSDRSKGRKGQPNSPNQEPNIKDEVETGHGRSEGQIGDALKTEEEPTTKSTTTTTATKKRAAPQKRKRGSVSAEEGNGGAAKKKEKKTLSWTESERATICSLVEKHGKSWTKIADQFNVMHGKTPDQIRFCYNAMEKEKGGTGG